MPDAALLQIKFSLSDPRDYKSIGRARGAVVKLPLLMPSNLAQHSKDSTYTYQIQKSPEIFTIAYPTIPNILAPRFPETFGFGKYKYHHVIIYPYRIAIQTSNATGIPNASPQTTVLHSLA